MDEAVKYFAKRDELVSKLKPVIGDNVDYGKMTIEEIVAYGCDKLDINPSYNGLNGYLAAAAKHQKIGVTVAKDSAFKPEIKNAALKDYLNGK